MHGDVRQTQMPRLLAFPRILLLSGQLVNLIFQELASVSTVDLVRVAAPCIFAFFPVSPSFMSSLVCATFATFQRRRCCY
jgi:hypothetical protein